MTQGIIIVVLTFVYTISSYIGAALFVYMWRLTHTDRVELNAPQASQSRKVTRLEHTIARRNEIVAGVLAVVFCFYSVAGTIGTLRVLGLDLPWERGLVTTFILVLANFLEMLIAVSLVQARRSVNRGLGGVRD